METMVGNTTIPEGIWQDASERILNMTYRRLNRVGAIRYFIVGNNVDGYCGIERDDTCEIEIDEFDRPVWRYIIMEPRMCKRIIIERIESSMKP